MAQGITGPASLTGTQNGVTVYNEVEDLNVPVSQRAGIKFPAFEPTASSIACFSCTEFFSNGHCVCEVVMDIDHHNVVDVNPD